MKTVAREWAGEIASGFCFLFSAFCLELFASQDSNNATSYAAGPCTPKLISATADCTSFGWKPEQMRK